MLKVFPESVLGNLDRAVERYKCNRMNPPFLSVTFLSRPPVCWPIKWLRERVVFQHRRLPVTHLSGEGQRPNSTQVPLRQQGSVVSSPHNVFTHLLQICSWLLTLPVLPRLFSHCQKETTAVKTRLPNCQLLNKKKKLYIDKRTETNSVLSKSLSFKPLFDWMSPVHILYG
jgi:hypothetical protein